MPFLWDNFVYSREFWLDYFSAAISFSGCTSLQNQHASPWLGRPLCELGLVYDFPKEQFLRIEIFYDEHRLELYQPESPDPLEIGIIGAHAMPDVWRWEEFQAINRHIQRRPSPPIWAHELLFSLYIPVTADCQAPFAQMLRACLEASQLFSVPEIDYIVAAPRFALRQNFQWTEVPGLGWVADGEQAYSLRDRSGEFDFLRFNAFLATVTADVDR